MDNESIIYKLKQVLPEVNSVDIRSIPPLTLAYVGDSVMDMLVRTYFSTSTHEVVSKLNKHSIGIVNAKAQAELLGVIEDKLDDEEKDIVRRGRNAKSATMPRHADMQDYRLATALEALMGYLFIQGRTERICELFGYMAGTFNGAAQL